MSKTHNAGIVTAYGAAVRGGYTGTYEQFCAQQAQYAENARQMEQAVSDVRQIKTSVESAVSEAEGYANNANQSATNASNSATQASESASNANQLAASASQFADNASSSANSAGQSATSAQTSATNASASEQSARQSAETAQDILDSVQAEGDTQINRVQSEGNTQIGRVQAKGNEILNSLPSDFTQVQNDIAALNGSLVDVKADLADRVNDSKSALNSRLNFLVLEQGSILATGTNAGKDMDAANRVRTVTKIEYPVHIDLSNTDYLVNTYNVYNKTTGAFIPPAVSPQGNLTKIIDIVPESGTYVRITFKHANGNDFTPGDLQPDLTLCNFETRIKSLETQTDNLQNQTDGIQAVVSTNENAVFTTGYFIKTSVGNTGSVIDVTPISNSSLAYYISECKPGDVYTITGTGGSSARLWCFLDRDYRRLLGKTAAENASATDLQLIADQPGYFICNVLIANPYSVVKTTVGDMTFDDIKDTFSQIDSELDAINGKLDNVTHITNPHYLFWRMGAFDVTGAQGFNRGMLAKDRFFTIVKVKAGSTVTKKSITRARNLAFGYKLSESDTTLSGYTSNAGNSITIEQDCIAYIGIRYLSPTEDLLDDTILDTFDFDLKVVDYKSRYARGDGSKNIFIPNGTIVYPRNYGWPCPEIYYEGQHTDETGWTNSFSDIAAIYTAFDTLATNSNSYLSRTLDYGVAYTGNADNSNYSADSEWHLYEYTTKPATGINTVPKVAITCCMHGNEKMSAYAMHYLMYDLIYNGTKNPALAWIKSNLIITFIPICNPYGFMSVIPQRLNENGVNLNRNFPTYNWDEWEDTRTDGNGSEYGGKNYKGQSAGSETETQMMMQFYRNHYDAVLAIDLHTDGADTAMRDQISAYMPALAQSESDMNYDILANFLTPGKNYTTRLKQWLNDKYNAGISYDYAYGTSIPISYYPCAPHWVRETAGLVGQCYEVMAGSSTGVMGTELTVYAPATIKAAAEELGNVLVALINHCKNL